MSSFISIDAASYAQDDRPVLECAERVAVETHRILATGANVVVSVRGLRGVSSSFFNVILAKVAASLPAQSIATRFSVDTDTETQRFIFERSLQAFVSRAG